MSERELAKLYESEIDELREQLAAAEARAERLEALCRRVCDIRCTQQMELEIAALRAAKEGKP